MLRTDQTTNSQDNKQEIPLLSEDLLLNAKELDELAKMLPPQEFKRFMKSEFLGHKLPYADEKTICCDNSELQIKRLGKNHTNTGLPDGLVVFSVWNKTTKTLGISFRGTNDKPSMGRDLESNPGHDTFHKGAGILATEINALLEKIEQAKPSNAPDITIDIYGHSLGGADAQRCVALLLKNILEWSDKNVERAVTYFNKIKCIHLHCLNTPGIATEDADTALKHLQLIKSNYPQFEIICDWIHSANDPVQAVGDTNLFANVLEENVVKHRMLHIEHSKAETNWLSSIVFFVSHFTQRAIKAHTGTAFTAQSNISKWFYATNATLKGAKFINAKATNKSLIDTSQVGKIVKNFLHACYTFVVPDTSTETNDLSHLPQQPFILVEHEDSVMETKQELTTTTAETKPINITPNQPNIPINSVNIHSLILQHKTKEVLQYLEQDAKCINEVDNRGMSLLQLAAREGLNDAVTYLCFKGAKLSAATEMKRNTATNPPTKSPMEYAQERGHTLIVKILKTFTAPNEGVDNNILKSLYVWAIKNYSSHEGLTLPAQPTQENCLGLLELAAFLNKPRWAEHLLTYQAISQLRHNANVRTPAYWAALNNNDELFKQLSFNENNLLLTLWQLKQDKPDLLAKYLTLKIQPKFKDFLNNIPDDKENLSVNSKYAYLATNKNDIDFVKAISDFVQRELKNYALAENNFTALTTMQNYLDKGNFDFLAGSLSFPALIEYELITQNRSYYDLLLSLSPHHQREFLNKEENRIGLLNFLLSMHVINVFLSVDAMDTYLVLIKNDKLVTELAERHIQDRNAHLHKPFLFKDLGVTLRTGKEVKLNLKHLSNDLTKHFVSFLSGSVKPHTRQQTKQKTILSLANTKLFTLTTDTTPDKIELKQLDQEVKNNQERMAQLDKEITTLTESKNQLMVETLENAQRNNRRTKNWIIANCIALPTTIAANTWCVLKLANEGKLIKQTMSLTPVSLFVSCVSKQHKISTTCSSFLSENNTGFCAPQKYLCPNNYLVTYSAPNECDDLCRQSFLNGLYSTLSLVTDVVIPLVITGYLIWELVQLKRNHDANYFGELHRYGTLLQNKLLSSYSKIFRKNIPAISPLLSQPIDEKTSASNANSYIENALLERKAEYLEYSTRVPYSIARRNIFTRLFMPDQEHKRITTESKQDSSIDIRTEEPTYVPRQGSINDDLSTSLLVREDKEPATTPRRSLCPSCVIL